MKTLTQYPNINDSLRAYLLLLTIFILSGILSLFISFDVVKYVFITAIVAAPIVGFVGMWNAIKSMQANESRWAGVLVLIGLILVASPLLIEAALTSIPLQGLLYNWNIWR